MPTYDYTQNGAYFVTICSYARECVFGKIVDGAMHLSDIGRVVEEERLRTPLIRPTVEMDDYVIMPNHLHGILIFFNPDGREMPSPESGDPQGTLMRRPRSLGAMVAGFKIASTTRVNIEFRIAGAPLWQRNYYERVIRNGAEAERIRSYIRANASHWHEDSEHVGS